MSRIPCCFSPRAFAIAVCLLVAGALHANDLVVGQPAPPIALDTLDGHHIALADLRGKTVILAFWSNACEPCREELPLLSRYARAHAGQGLVVLGFSLDGLDELPRVHAMAKTLDFPVGLLGDPHVPGYGRIWRLPVSFVVDRDGVLADDGWKDSQPAWTQARLGQVVTPLLRTSR